MPNKRRMRPTIQLLPNPKHFEERRETCRKFKPHDFRSLIEEAKEQNADLISVVRSRNDEQMQELLESLGLDPSRPDVWQRGFFLLAHYHHGVCHITWSPRRTNSNPSTWTLDRNLAFLYEITTLTAAGLSERAAVRQIASDPAKQKLFPYRRQTGRYFAKMSDSKRREAALWAHLQKLKSSSKHGLLRALGGREAIARDPFGEESWTTLIKPFGLARYSPTLSWLKTNRALFKGSLQFTSPQEHGGCVNGHPTLMAAFPTPCNS